MTIAEKSVLNCGFDVTRGQNRGMWCSCCCCPEKNREWPGILLQLSVSGNWALTKISLLKIVRTVVSHYTPIPEKTGSCMEVRPYSPCGKFEITYMADDHSRFPCISCLVAGGSIYILQREGPSHIHLYTIYTIYIA